jgi:hypothetical protein
MKSFLFLSRFDFQIFVDEAVRDVERHVMLWDDEQARLMDNQSSLQQIVVKEISELILGNFLSCS